MDILKILPFLLLVFWQCNTEDSDEEKLIAGQWHGAQWLVNGRESEDYDPDVVDFTFDEKKHYHSQLGDKSDKGTYYIQDHYLHTVSGGELEIMVKIVRISQDSLVLDMNRGGQAETLLLLREK